MKRPLRLILVLFVLSVLLIPAGDARADIAPPIQPPGSNPQPGSATQVRMLAETVVLAVRQNPPSDSPGWADVTADFTMRNLGTQSETLAVQFPLSASDGWGAYPEISAFAASVDGQAVTYRRVMGPDPLWNSQDPVAPWAEFDVTFPPGQDVAIRVTYGLKATSNDDIFITFGYLLNTGAGWNGTIGSADLIVRLPYPADAQNVVFDQIGWGETSTGGVFSGNDLRWHYDELEPEISNNLQVALVRPELWRKILTERQNTQTSPNDGEAWGRLGRACKQAFLYGRGFRLDPGGQALYAEGLQAYQHAVDLLPNDPLWHAGYADLLSVHAYYAYFGTSFNAESLHAVQEIQAALQLAPNDATVQRIAEQVSSMFPGAMELVNGDYVFVWLTATPTAAPTETPVVTTVPPTLLPTFTPLPLTPSTPSPVVTPVCGAALLPVLFLLALAWRGRSLL